MPTGTGAVSLRNLPTAAYEVNPAKFFALTERNIFAPANFDLPAPANYTTRQLLQVGVVSKLQLIVKGTAQVTAAAGNTVTKNYKWPYGLIKNITVSGNGVNNFINCSGYDLYIRKLCQYRAFVDNYTVDNVPAGALAANGNYQFNFTVEIPLAMDDSSLIGSLYAQSEATNLTVQITTESIANLFTLTGTGAVALVNYANTAATNPTCYLQETFFEVPYDPQKPGTLVIPDLTVLHGIIANDNPVAGMTTVTTEVYRINGQMERLIYYCDNANALVTTANFARHRLVYGGSQTPLDFNPPDQLRVLNNEWYRLALPDGVYALDMIAENPQRDQILLEGITNLRLITDYAGGFVPNAAARMHFVQETLFA